MFRALNSLCTDITYSKCIVSSCVDLGACSEEILGLMAQNVSSGRQQTALLKARLTYSALTRRRGQAVSHWNYS
jgi:hypothetical protein